MRGEQHGEGDLPNEDDVRDQEEFEEGVPDWPQRKNGGQRKRRQTHRTPSHPAMRKVELLG